jgi:hypothetical protein
MGLEDRARRDPERVGFGGREDHVSSGLCKGYVWWRGRVDDVEGKRLFLYSTGKECHSYPF